MNENTTHTELLIRYLDNELTTEEQEAVKNTIADNANVKQELNQLTMARDAVRVLGLKEQLARVRKEMKQEVPVVSMVPKAKLGSLLLTRLSIAASILIILGLAVFYEYSSTTSENLYGNNFKAYTLTQSRGENNAAAIEDAFKNKNYRQVIGLFNNAASHTAEEYFLAGNANLANNNAAEAIKNFTALQQKNKSDQTHYFKDDAEYYLAMSYLKNEQPSFALPLFEKIYNDKTHPYNDKVSKWFLWKLQVLSRK